MNIHNHSTVYISFHASSDPTKFQDNLPWGVVLRFCWFSMYSCVRGQVAFFRRKVIFSISEVLERLKESISRFPANFKEISESQIFDLSRDQTSQRA